MFHPDTQFAIDLWTGLAEAPVARGGVPCRSTLKPEAFGPRLARAALIQGFGRDAAFRLAGGGLEALHRRGLNGLPLSRLWTSPTAELPAEARVQALGEGRPMVLTAMSDREALEVEILLAPLRDRSGRADLTLMTLAWRGELPRLTGGVRRLAVRSAVAVGEPRRPRLGLAAIDGRRIA